MPNVSDLLSSSTLENMTQVIVAALTVLGAFAGVFPRRKNRSLRDNLKVDVELVSLLPDGETRNKLNDHISDMVDQLRSESSYRRDPFGIALGLSLMLIGGGGTIWVINAGSWWLLLLAVLVPVFVVGFAGMIADSAKTKRDDKGTPT